MCFLASSCYLHFPRTCGLENLAYIRAVRPIQHWSSFSSSTSSSVLGCLFGDGCSVVSSSSAIVLSVRGLAACAWWKDFQTDGWLLQEVFPSKLGKEDLDTIPVLFVGELGVLAILEPHMENARLVRRIKSRHLRSK